MNEVEIKSVIERYSAISPASYEEFLKGLEELSVSKGTDFIRKDGREFYEYIILDGICRSYLINPSGDEVTISLFGDQSVLSPYITRTREGLSTLNFQAITDTRMVKFSASDFEELMVQNLEFREWGNEVLKHELAMKVSREIDLASITAKERLFKFRELFPMFENLIPHPIIASYLGITNVSLSRLRKTTM
ncbi:MAG: Crp/Fnr family transcriptional regulator [Crocinitomicaceae bacterium]|nr:Crp/Fnr family transcriptional regulator [Crocinitomicaceae bacterium]